MENNGRGIFYGVIGVATLIVAIIGATFAYFTASASTDEGAITGQTENNLAQALDVSVGEVTFDNPGVNSHNLVPAKFGDGLASPSAITVNDVQGAIRAKCANAGYTGCHLWKVTAKSTQTIDNASVILSMSVNAKDKDQWGYAIFTSTNMGDVADGDSKFKVTDPSTVTITSATVNNSETNAAITDGWKGSIGSGVSNLDFHANKGLTKDTPVTYYILVFLNDLDKGQNVEGQDTVDATGTYSGTVTMNAAGGKVRASFTATQ